MLTQAPFALLAQATPAQPLAPGWLIVPVALIALVVVAGHWWALARADMPPLRKRLRSANGLLMMLVIPMLAFGFGVATPAQGRVFVLAWLLTTGMLLLVLLVACVDLLLVWNEARVERRRIRAELDALRAAMARHRSGAAPLPDQQSPHDGSAPRSH